jgi:HSP20 family protein
MLSPFRGFHDTRGEVDCLFDEMIGGLGRRRERRKGLRFSGWAPAADAFTKDADLVIRAELPGVKQEDVDITLRNGLLTISGEHKVDGEEEHGGYHLRARRHGAFRRSMTLPEGIDDSKIRAKFEDGVLEVVVEGAACRRERFGEGEDLTWQRECATYAVSGPRG